MSSIVMTDNEEKALDALAISQLGKAFGDRLKDEKAEMERALAERESVLARLESTMAAALAEVKERAGVSAMALAELRAERDAATAASLEAGRREREALDAAQALRAERDAATAASLEAGRREKEALDAAQALGAERDAAAQKLAAEATRLKLVHQAQVEALFARHRELGAGLQDSLAESRARLTELEGQRDEARDEVARLREQLRALAQEASEVRFARGEAEIALQAQKEANAVLDARFRAVEERLGEEREAVVRAEDRIAALMRNARAREAMLQEAAQEERLQGQISSMRERIRGDRLASQVATLAFALQKTGQGNSALSAVLEGLGAEDGSPKAATQSVEEAVGWLAAHAGPAMAGGNNAMFEVAAASCWSDETWVAASYRWLLGRPVDEAGRAHYLQKLGGSMTRRDMLVDLACSPEARSRLQEGSAVRGAEDRHFILAAYESILDRGADTGGLEHYLARIAGGMSRGQVLLDMARSLEAREAATPVGSSLLAIRQAGLPYSRWRERIRRSLLRHLPGWRHAWEAGRLAGLHCDINLAQEAAGRQLADIGHHAEQRVAAARGAALAEASGARQGSDAVPAAVAGAFAAPAGSQMVALPVSVLTETSAQRSADQIVGLIRQELNGQGLN